MTRESRPKICDPHVHLFPEGQLRRPYRIDDLSADLADGHDVVATVYIEAFNGYRAEGPEAFRPVGESEWVVSEDPAGLLSAVVGYADLQLGNDVEGVLEAHRDAAAGRFRGVRYRPNWDRSPDVPNSRFADGPGLLADPRVRDAVAVIGRLGLTLDLFVYFHQLDDVASLAHAHPDVPIVINHFGAPLGIGPYAGRRREVMHALRRGLEPLAPSDNVYLKLGGLGWPGHGFGWETQPEPPAAAEVAAVWAPLHAWCIDTFGPDRCMCGATIRATDLRFPTERSGTRTC